MFSGFDSITVILLVAIVLVLGGLFTARVVQRIRMFREDLYYIELEISRSIGEEKKHWVREKRRLWLSVLPFYREGREVQMMWSLKKLLNTITTVIVALVVLLALMLVGMRLLGLEVFTVLSGSMEPEYPVGSLIYVKKMDCAQLRIGDVITFMVDEDTVVTHRIAEIIPDENESNTLWFRTKGDANKQEDTNPVHYRNVIGKAVFSIPYLGYVADYIQNPPGMYVALGAGAVMLLLAFLPEKKKKEMIAEQP